MKAKAKKKVVGLLSARLAAHLVASFALAWASYAPVALFGAGADVDGNAITGKTLFGDVDGSASTVGDVLGVGGFVVESGLAGAVAGAGFATTGYVDAATNALSAAVDARGYVYTNDFIMATGQLAVVIAESRPADYATVSNMAMSAVQFEQDPWFYAWKDDDAVHVGNNALVIGNSIYPNNYGIAIGKESRSHIDGVAVGSYAYATHEKSVAVGPYAKSHGIGTFNVNAASPSMFYFGDATLQSYFDEYALRYTFAAPATNAIAAADGTLYSVTADADGLSVTLPAASAKYVQDFIIRLAPTDENGTCIAAILGASTDSTDWQFDYPTGTNAVFGTITAPTYFTFTQVASNRWSVTTYAATKEE